MSCWRKMAVCLALVTVIRVHCVSGEVLSTGVQAGTYYLKVATEMKLQRLYLPDGAYYVTISSGTDLSDVEFEANDSLSDAQPVSLNQPYEGQLSGMSDVDYYKFSVDQRVKLSIAFSSEKSYQDRLEL